MFTINGIPLLQRNIELMRDQMGIGEIVIITGHLGSVIEDYFGDGSKWGVQLYFIRNHNVDRGLAWSVFLSRKFVDDYFCVILGDEYYQGANHQQLAKVNYERNLAICAIKKGALPATIQENYGVRISNNGAIRQLIEKPVAPKNDLLGCGTFIFSPVLFPLLEKGCDGSEHYADFISLLNTFCQQGYSLDPFWLEGHYVNINDSNGLELAALHEASAASIVL